jgi:hypothetical protein
MELIPWVSFHQQIGLKFEEETKCCIWSIASYVAGNWTLQKVYEKYLESSEAKC